MFNLAKGFASKVCFCLGLGTATVFSYGQVKQWVQPEATLTTQNSVQNEAKSEVIASQDSYTPAEYSYEQPEEQSPLSNVADELKAAAVPAVVAEKTEEEKKEEPAKVEENSELTDIAGQVVPQLPYSYSPYVSAPSVNNPAPTEAQAAAPLAALPNAMPTATPVDSSSSSSQGGGSSGYSSNNSNPYSSLEKADIAALISGNKAYFPDQYVSVRGIQPPAKRPSTNSVHTLQWGFDTNRNEGLKSDAKFTIALSNSDAKTAAELKFKLEFSIQSLQNGSLYDDLQQVDMPQPSEILVHQEVKGAQLFRVIEINFPSFQLPNRSEVTLEKVSAVMIYEVTSNGLVLTSNSRVSFSRSNIQVALVNWDAGFAARNPAADRTISYVNAYEVPYSINVEKP